MADAVMALGEGEKVMVMGPVVDGRKGTHQKLLARLIKDGYTRVRVDGDHNFSIRHIFTTFSVDFCYYLCLLITPGCSFL